MRAVRLHEFGGPEQLRVEEVPTPEPGPGQALVRVAACGVNHLDLWLTEGTLPVKPKLPHTPGSEVAGTVAALGTDVANAREGDAVAVHPYLHCGQCEFCLSGEETTCLRGDILGLMSEGGYAEYVLVPANSLVPLPAGVEAVQAAALTLSALTAWHMLRRARLQLGETVLVWGGNSGVGSAAVQIANRMGARVLATVGSTEKAERVRALGAEATIDHYQQDVGRAVRDLTDKRGVDVVFEHVGQATWPASVSALARNGRLVTCGATTGAEVGFNLWPFFAKQLEFIGCYGGTHTELAHVLGLAADGALQAVVDATYPLDGVPAALRRLAAHEQFGKLVITP
ncbi:MAG TPA: alcohol dehydrogenase catalytic domain-containing protein [Chloroflexota bacterium]|nr:alcohol dehydrogenase catalytic domain-containing protein [Chloroflexota bacterium]